MVNTILILVSLIANVICFILILMVDNRLCKTNSKIKAGTDNKSDNGYQAYMILKEEVKTLKEHVHILNDSISSISVRNLKIDSLINDLKNELTGLIDIHKRTGNELRGLQEMLREKLPKKD